MTMDDRDGHIWLDGEWLDWREAKTHVLTYTLHYGLGVFEGLRAYQTEVGAAIFRLQDHTDRLFRSAHILNIKASNSFFFIFSVLKSRSSENRFKPCTSLK